MPEPATLRPPLAAKIREDILPYMDAARAAVRALNMNAVERHDKASYFLHAQVDRMPKAWEPGISAEEKAKRERVRCERWAEYEALRELEREGDVTPDRRAYWLERAAGKLTNWQEYHAAAEVARDVETDRLGLEDNAPSATRKVLIEWCKDAADDVARYLSFALTREMVDFLCPLGNRGWRARAKFQLFRKIGSRRVALFDARLQTPVLRFPMEHFISKARTLAEVKFILECWNLKGEAVRRGGETVVVGEGFEVCPTR